MKGSEAGMQRPLHAVQRPGASPPGAQLTMQRAIVAAQPAATRLIRASTRHVFYATHLIRRRTWRVTRPPRPLRDPTPGKRKHRTAGMKAGAVRKRREAFDSEAGAKRKGASGKAAANYKHRPAGKKQNSSAGIGSRRAPVEMTARKCQMYRHDPTASTRPRDSPETRPRDSPHLVKIRFDGCRPR